MAPKKPAPKKSLTPAMPLATSRRAQPAADSSMATNNASSSGTQAQSSSSQNVPTTKADKGNRSTDKQSIDQINEDQQGSSKSLQGGSVLIADITKLTLQSDDKPITKSGGDANLDKGKAPAATTTDFQVISLAGQDMSNYDKKQAKPIRPRVNGTGPIAGHIPVTRLPDTDRPVNNLFVSNHFPLTLVDRDMYLYPANIIDGCLPQSVQKRTGTTMPTSVDPSKLAARKIRRIFVLLLKLLKSHFGSSELQIASNYQNQFVTFEPLGFGDKEFPVAVSVPFYDEDVMGPSADPYTYWVRIGHPKILPVAKLHRTVTMPNLQEDDRMREQDMDDLRVDLTDALNMFCSQVANDKTARMHGAANPTMAAVRPARYYPFVQHRASNMAFDTSKGPWDVYQGLCAVPGFSRSVRARPFGQYLLNINTTTSAFVKWSNLSLVLRERFIDPPAPRRGQEILWDDMDRFVKNLRVQAQYGNKRIYTLTGLAELEHDVGDDGDKTGKGKEKAKAQRRPWSNIYRPSPDNVTFMKGIRDGNNEVVKQKNTSVRNHFLEEYKIKLPLDDIIVRYGSHRPVNLPASQLVVLPGQFWKRKEDAVAEKGRRDADDNRDLIMDKGKTAFGMNNDETKAAFGISLANNGAMVSVPSIRLPFGGIQYRNRQFSGQSSWPYRGTGGFRLPTAEDFRQRSTWSILDFRNSSGRFRWNEHQYRTFCGMFQRALNTSGLQTLRESVGYANDCEDHKFRTDENGIKGREDDLRAYLNAWPQVGLWVVLLRQQDSKLYAQIKTITDLEFGVPTICLTKTMKGTEPDHRCMANLTLKANLKLSGHSVNQRLTNANHLLGEKTMVVGIDVTHYPGEQTSSIAAMVASHDRDFAQWPASIRWNSNPPSDSGQSMERCVRLREMITERLHTWRDHHRRELPNRIIIYRDGLSESQFDMCRANELTDMIDAMQSMYARQSQRMPEILLVCAVKRHNTRFYSAEKVDNDSHLQEGRNPVPGTAIFGGVTYGEEQDFFLISQSAMLAKPGKPTGTVRPTHYVVLHNTIPGTSIKDVAHMTLDLCLIYGRATTAVGVATPGYYADLACTRARKYVDADPSLITNPNRSLQPPPNTPLHERMFYI